MRRGFILAMVTSLMAGCGGGGGGGGDGKLELDYDLATKYVGTWKSDCVGLDIGSISILEDGATQNHLVNAIETIELTRINNNELRGKRRIDVYNESGEIGGGVKCAPSLFEGSIAWNDDERENFTTGEGVAQSGAGLRILINQQAELAGGEKVDQVVINLDNLTPVDQEYNFGKIWYSPWHIVKLWDPVDIVYINKDKMTFGERWSGSMSNSYPTKLKQSAGFTKQIASLGN